jgi:PKD domain
MQPSIRTRTARCSARSRLPPGTLVGQFVDAGSLSAETVTVDWGDGTTDTVLQNASGQSVFADTHQYLDDNPTGTPSDSYNIKVTVTDNDNLSDSSTTSVTVDNVPPVITSVSTSATTSNLAKEGQPVSLQGAFTDVGTQDTHTATVDWGDGTVDTAQVTEAGGNGTFSDSHVFASGGIYPLLITVKDDDTGQATTSTQAFVSGFGIHTFNGLTVLQGVGTNQSDTMVVKQHKDTLDVSATARPDRNESGFPRHAGGASLRH